MELHWIELEWNWNELHWTELNWIGIGIRTELNWIGLELELNQFELELELTKIEFDLNLIWIWFEFEFQSCPIRCLLEIVYVQIVWLVICFHCYVPFLLLLPHKPIMLSKLHIDHIIHFNLIPKSQRFLIHPNCNVCGQLNTITGRTFLGSWPIYRYQISII